MFSPDIMAMAAFYHSVQGEMVRRVLQKPITRFIRLGQTTPVGIGYTFPFIEDPRVLHVVPSLMACPDYRLDSLPPRSCIADLCELPFEDEAIDRLLVIHALEYSSCMLEMLGECWRVLEPGGTMLLVVPNRRGFWSMGEQTPFGYGHPFHPMQLTHMLVMNRFKVTTSQTALFLPPSENAIILKTSALFEWVGRYVLPAFQGVLVVEARKDVFALIPPASTELTIKKLIAPAVKTAISRHPRG